MIRNKDRMIAEVLGQLRHLGQGFRVGQFAHAKDMGTKLHVSILFRSSGISNWVTIE